MVSQECVNNVFEQMQQRAHGQIVTHQFRLACITTKEKNHAAKNYSDNISPL